MVMSVDGLAFSGAIGADSLDHVIDGFGLETIGQLYVWNGGLLQAEGAVTDLTVKMHVAVIVNIAGGVAEFVSDSLTAVVNLVQEMVLVE
jgi:hypothetical protein